MYFRFKNFTVDAERFEIRQNDELIKAEPQVIELLIFLIKNRERLVSKEDIFETIWKDRVVSDSAISSRIKTLRRVLGDDGHAQHTIQTIPKKGFRFILDVVENSDRFNKNEHNPKGDEIFHKPSIAILPFDNYSDENSNEYFSDGITTDIISLLSKHKGLDVTARNVTFGFKNQPINHQELRSILNIDYVLEGSVQRIEKQIRINVQLTDAKNNHLIWAEKYNRQFDDIFILQDEITATIVARLEPEIGYSERNKIIHNRPQNLHAWENYHLGIYHLFKFTNEDNLKAQHYLLQSQQLDSSLGEALSWWGYANILGMVYWETKPTQKLLDASLNACNEALVLDNQNATFHALKARVLLARCEYKKSITSNETAIKLNPTFAVAYCSLGDSLAYEGRLDESIAYFSRAIELSPNDPQLWAFYTYGALALIFKKDYETALDWIEKASNNTNYQYWTTAHKLVALAYLNKADQLAHTKSQLLKEKPNFTSSFAREKLFYIKDQSQIELYIKGLELAGL